MEKRKDPRFPTAIVTELHSHGAVTNSQGCITDLSMGGMGFESEAEFPEGTAIFMTFNLPVEIQGKITHIESKGGLRKYGVEFTGLGAVEKQHLEKFVIAKFKK